MSSSPREPLSRKSNTQVPRSTSRRVGQDPLRETPSRQGGVSRSNFTRSQKESRDSLCSGTDRVSPRRSRKDCDSMRRPSTGRETSGRTNVGRVTSCRVDSRCDIDVRESSGRISPRQESMNHTGRTGAVRGDAARSNSERTNSNRLASGSTGSHRPVSGRETIGRVDTSCPTSRQRTGANPSHLGTTGRNAGVRDGSVRNASARGTTSRGAVNRDARNVRDARDRCRASKTRGRRSSGREPIAHAPKNELLSKLSWNTPLDTMPFAGLKRVLVIGVCVVALLLMLFSVDYAMNMNKIHSGVAIGDVDVSGMTKDEATKAVSEHYASGIANNEILLFADQKTADEYQKGVDVFHEDQYSEEEKGSSRAWRLTASTLTAELDADSAVERAYQVGREGHRLERISSIFGGVELAPVLTLNDEKVEEYVEKVASASGELRVENEVVVEEGVARAIQGHDGVMPDYDELKRLFTNALLDVESEETDVVPELQPISVSHSFEAAEAVAETINTALSRPVTFTYKDVSFDVPREVIGSWVTTELVGKKGNMTIKPLIDTKLGQDCLLNYADSHNISVSHSVKFAVKGDSVNVHITGADEIPQYGKAVEDLNTAFFETTGKAAQGPISISITYGSVPADMSFEQACDKGVISEISSYTTEYTPDVEGRNFNIHHMADFINNSVIPSKGEWSMLDTAGEISKENGYMPGGQIVGDEVVQDYGGDRKSVV